MASKPRFLLIYCLLPIACCLTLSSCSGHAESFGAGLTAGSVVTHTLEGINQDLDAKQAALITERQVILDELATANDAAETLMLTAKVDSLTKQLTAAADTQTAVTLGKDAVAMDWSDPSEYAPWLSSAVLAAVGIWIGRKKKQPE